MIKLCEILNYLETQKIKYTYLGKKELEIISYCPLKLLRDSCITWIRNMSNENMLYIKNHNDLLIVCESFEGYEQCGNFICVENPHKTFFKVMEKFFVHTEEICEIASSAVIETKQLGKNNSIGNFTYIGPDVVLGNNVRIDHNVTIEGKVTICDNTIIESGVVIGLCGFGHYKEDGINVRIPHLGGVMIGSDCYIGSNTTIARGTLSDTCIGNHVKIDALCHIAHNVEIGNNVIITGGAKIAGSTIIEDDVWIGPNTIINNGLTIGKHSFIGIGSVVTKNVPEEKEVFGFPARVIKNNTPNVYNS